MNKSIFLAAMAAPAAFGGDSIEQAGPAFEAASVRHSGTVHVDAPPELAFQLFTAPGERLWVNGWDPVVLSGGDGRNKGSVFVTTHKQDVTIWLVVDYDPDSLHARYARVTPTSRAGTVEVFARSDGEGGAEVDVTYELTALSETGNQTLADFDGPGFSRMMTEWEDAIRMAEVDFQAHFAQ